MPLLLLLGGGGSGTVELDRGALVGSGVGVEAAEDALRRVHGPLDKSRPKKEKKWPLGVKKEKNVPCPLGHRATTSRRAALHSDGSSLEPTC